MSVRDAIRAELASLGAAGLRPFDVHSHTGADVDGTARTHEQLISDLAPLDARSVAFPFCVAAGYEAENRRVIEECGRQPQRLVPFARLDPRVSGAEDAERALAAGARGFKLHPRSEAFRLDHPNVDAIAAVAAAARAPLLIHAGIGVGSLGAPIVELAARRRGCPIVLAHAAVSDLAWLWEVVPDHPNLFFDTSWWSPTDLLALFALVPPGRVLFGSDAPYMDFELLLVLALRCARHAGLSEEAIALMAGGQLEALLAGEAPIDAGPAPGPLERALTPGESRLVAMLTAAGGCMLGGGDPSLPLELAALAVDGCAPAAGAGQSIGGLIETAGSASPEAIWAIALALGLATTPSVGSEVLVA